MPPIWNILISTFILIFSSWAYMKLALRYGIIDKPNNRSSHTNPTVRGGGVVFVIAVLLFFISNQFQYPFFVAGLFLVAIISFLDDIYTLGSLYRLAVQFIAVTLTIYNVVFFDETLIVFLGLLIFATGLLNIYNFMDGINGITGLYSIAVLLPLLYLNSLFSFVDNELLMLSLISVLIFGFYNFRKSAKYFAGDVGSITIGITLIFCVGLLIKSQHDYSYIFLFLIYLVDGGVTILERLFRRENIFSPHRNHLYQLLIDKKKHTHLQVSLTYSLVQLAISSLLIWRQNEFNIISISILIIIVVLGYVGIKRKVSQNGTSIST